MKIEKLYSIHFMKKFLILFLVIFFISCNSDYDYDLQDRVQYVTDDDGDPVIENIKDNEEVGSLEI